MHLDNLLIMIIIIKNKITSVASARSANNWLLEIITD